MGKATELKNVTDSESHLQLGVGDCSDTGHTVKKKKSKRSSETASNVVNVSPSQAVKGKKKERRLETNSGENQCRRKDKGNDRHKNITEDDNTSMGNAAEDEAERSQLNNSKLSSDNPLKLAKEKKKKKRKHEEIEGKNLINSVPSSYEDTNDNNRIGTGGNSYYKQGSACIENLDDNKNKNKKRKKKQRREEDCDLQLKSTSSATHSNTEADDETDKRKEKRKKKQQREEDCNLQLKSTSNPVHRNTEADDETTDKRKEKRKKKQQREEDCNLQLKSTSNAAHSNTEADDETTDKRKEKRKKKQQMEEECNLHLKSTSNSAHSNTEADDETDKRKEKRKKRQQREEDCDPQLKSTTNTGHSNTDTDCVTDKKEKRKKKKKKENGLRDLSKDITLKESHKKVRFSDHPEVFPLSDEKLVRGKRFTVEEDEIVRSAVYRYVEEYRLGKDGVDMVLNCISHRELKGCWKDIASAIPWRHLSSVYHRAHILLGQKEKTQCPWTPEELNTLWKFHEEHGPKWKLLADELGRNRLHIKDAWRRHKLGMLKRGFWTQEEYQHLFDLVNKDLCLKVHQEKKTKHGMLRDNIAWEAIGDTVGTRTGIDCCNKWYDKLTSPMVREGLWADADDYRLIKALVDLDACCIEDVDWDYVLEHRSGDLCLKRWNQMSRHLGKSKSFAEQVEILAKRYCPEMAEVREILDNKPIVDA